MNRVEVTGLLTTGERILGIAELRLVGPPSPRAGASALCAVSLPGEWPLRVATGASAALVDLAAHDVNGRLVRRRRATPDSGGVVECDGRSAAGERVPSGIYFIRPERAARGGASARVVLLR